jgi:hypothetical protein
VVFVSPSKEIQEHSLNDGLISNSSHYSPYKLKTSLLETQNRDDYYEDEDARKGRTQEGAGIIKLSRSPVRETILAPSCHKTFTQ